MARGQSGVSFIRVYNAALTVLKKATVERLPFNGEHAE
jgi:hypothetical protein